MPASKHKFSCGHRGHGAKCHRCAQADKYDAAAAKAHGEEKRNLEYMAQRMRAMPGAEITKLSVTPQAPEPAPESDKAA